MVLKKIVTATAALALAITPAVAASSSASSLSVVPAAESVEGAELGGSSLILVALAVVAAGLGLWAIIDSDDEAPVSP